MSKYDPLSGHLRRQRQDELELSFPEIERILGGRQAGLVLPPPDLKPPLTLARRQGALDRLVERGPGGLVRVKGTPFGRLAERRRSRP